MVTIKFAFQDGIVGLLDFNSRAEAEAFAAKLKPETLKRHEVVGFVIVPRTALKAA